MSWLLADRRRFETWLAGYELGIQHGIAEGRKQANEEWTSVTVTACRAGLKLQARADAEANRRRNIERRDPPLTADQLRQRAQQPWGEPERRNTA